MGTARKWIAREYGGPEVLQEVDAEVAEPGRGEVVQERLHGAAQLEEQAEVRVRLAGVRVVAALHGVEDASA